MKQSILSGVRLGTNVCQRAFMPHEVEGGTSLWECGELAIEFAPFDCARTMAFASMANPSALRSGCFR